MSASGPNLRRLARRLYYDLRLLATGGRGIAVTVAGESFRLLPESAAASDPAYEDDKYRTVMAELRPGMTVFDLGAHHGLYTLGMAKYVGETGRVVCFEPCPENLRILRGNLRLNPSARRVRVEPLAVAGTTGTAAFSADPSDLTSGTLAEGGIPVAVTTLDAYCARTGLRPGVIKLDVEGAEYEILQGAAQLLRERGPVLHVELHPEQLRKRGLTRASIPEFAVTFGYEVFDHVGRPLPRAAWDTVGHVRLAKP